MNFTGTIILDAEPARVWQTLLDVHEVAECIPGLQSVSQIDEQTFDGIIEASVGPMSGKFSFRAHITESDPPRELIARLDGADSVTKSTVNGDTRVTLTPIEGMRTGDGMRTELRYDSTVNVKGRLAILGEMVLRATGNLMLQETAERLRKRVEGSKRPESSEPSD